MPTNENPLDSILNRPETLDSVAKRASSLIEGQGGAVAASHLAATARNAGPVAASPVPDIRNAAGVAASPITGELKGLVSSAVMANFASGIATRLGFPASNAAGNDSLTVSIASALRHIPEMASHINVASEVAGRVASVITARIVASPAIAKLIDQHVRSISVASTITRLGRHSTIDT